MADDVLRGLERRYRETGAVDDHARWVSARVRAGALSEWRAELAAEVGHEAARLALGLPRAPLGQPSILELGRRSAVGEAELDGRLALAVSRLALEGELSPRERDGLERLRAWIDCPCETHDAALEAAAGQVLSFSEDELRALFPDAEGAVLEEVLVELRATPVWPRDLSLIGWRHHQGGRDTADDEDTWPAWTRLRHAILDAPDGQRRLVLHGILVSIRWVGSWSAVTAATARVGEATVRAAIAAAVGPWLLLEEDARRG